MQHEQRIYLLQQIAEAIVRRRMVAPARIALDIVAPLGFLASQVALFVRPLTPLGRWHDYVAALEDEQSWHVLQDLVDARDNGTLL